MLPEMDLCFLKQIEQFEQVWHHGVHLRHTGQRDWAHSCG